MMNDGTTNVYFIFHFNFIALQVQVGKSYTCNRNYKYYENEAIDTNKGSIVRFHPPAIHLHSQHHCASPRSYHHRILVWQELLA